MASEADEDAVLSIRHGEGQTLLRFLDDAPAAAGRATASADVSSMADERVPAHPAPVPPTAQR